MFQCIKNASSATNMVFILFFLSLLLKPTIEPSFLLLSYADAQRTESNLVMEHL